MILVLKRTLLFMVLWVPLFLLVKELLIAKTHLTVTECGVTAIILTVFPPSLFVQFWLAPRLGLQYPGELKRTLG
jgi:hypothetical protein